VLRDGLGEPAREAARARGPAREASSKCEWFRESRGRAPKGGISEKRWCREDKGWVTKWIEGW